MKVLRLGDRGPDVKRWQFFLVGQGLDPGVADGIFGPRTEEATKLFQQRHGLVVDGIVANRTFGQAMLQGLEIVKDPAADTSSANWPARPTFRPLVGTAARQQAFGKFRFEHHPVPGNPENIRVLGGWAQENIGSAHLPGISRLRLGPSSEKIQFFRRAIPQLEAMWAEWEKNDLLGCMITWDGSYVPRFIRGSTSTLSNHAFGTAFDVNAAWNPLGTQPALMGKQGCVRELVEIANQHGFYWGGHFQSRPDGMHFEVAELRS